MKKKEPEMKTSDGYTVEPVRFADTNTGPAVTLKLPTKTPGYEIVPLRMPLEVHTNMFMVKKV